MPVTLRNRFSVIAVSTVVMLVTLSGIAFMVRRPPPSPVSSSEFAHALAYFDSAVVVDRTRSSTQTTTGETVALGYLERLRLGLGSPFRLADFALHDPRLDAAGQARVAWAIVGRVLRGNAYVVDPVVLDGLGPWRDAASTPTGVDHLALIERTVAQASDPRAGALTVRLAYTLAAGEHTVRGGVVQIAAQVAALVSDRRLAQEDARRLLERARTDGIPVLDDQRMRDERSFLVEGPPVAWRDPAREADAIERAPRLLSEIRELKRGPLDSAAIGGQPRAPLLGVASADRLAKLGASNPPEAPVAVALRIYHAQLLDSAAATATTEPAGWWRARERFASASRNEETLTGNNALLLAASLSRNTDDSPAVPSREPALALLAAATGLRANAQESPWFPGVNGSAPTVADLRSDFGLASVSFEAAVPGAWRPHYLARLASAIRGVQSVLPGFSVRGMRVHFGTDTRQAESPLSRALAVHDPSSRTIRLSIVWSAGTLAHELSHDLDWQADRRLYASTGGYSTDRAMHLGLGPLAVPVRGLTAARLASPLRAVGAAGTTLAQPAERPAEVFARDMDWFIATSLAQSGRSDGYASAAQDALITGYAGVAPAEITPRTGRALVDALGQMTDVSESLRQRFLDDWAGDDPARADPYLLVRRVLDAAPLRSRGSFSAVAVWPAAFAYNYADLCVDVASVGSAALRARAKLFDAALEARALGIARMRARSYAEAWRPAWARGILGEAPWSEVDGRRMIARIRDGIVAQLERNQFGEVALSSEFPRFRMSTGGCAR